MTRMGAPPFIRLPRRCLAASLWIMLYALALCPLPALAQGIDCARIPAQIAALDSAAPARPNHDAAALRRQRTELDRAVSYARSLGCDRPQIPFFGSPAAAQCPGLNAQIQQMQNNLGQLQSGGSQSDRAAAKADLMARYNAYCRGVVQAAVQPRQRGFFDQLFGGGDLFPHSAPNQPFEEQPRIDEEEAGARGGSQAVCVRSCDGGFFPLSISARRADSDHLSNLCQALCPNVTVSVYTRSPNREISTAVSLDTGEAYVDMPNASKFQKSFDPACTCKPPGQSWVEALAGAERLLGQERKGDILVTDEKAAELSAPKADSKRRSKAGAEPNPISTNPAGKEKAGKDLAGGAASNPPVLGATAKNAAGPNHLPGETQEVIGPDGLKRRVRIVAPTL